MSSPAINPMPPVEEPELTSEEWWALFDQLRLSQQEDYAKYGGPVEFFRRLRDDDPNVP